MKTALFVVVGIVLGVIAAKVRTSSLELVPSIPETITTPQTSSKRTPPVHKPGRRQRDISPTDAHYDPVSLSKEEDTLSFKDIFASEPRDPNFAPLMEKRMHDALDVIFHELELGDKAHEQHTECKTLSCYTSIQIPRADGRQLYKELSGVLLGDSQNPTLVDDADSALSDIVIYTIYHPNTRDDDHYKYFLGKGMRPSLEFVKETLMKEQHEAPH